MGQGLPKAVTSVVVKRVGAAQFRVGFAEMNGWRPSMEDAHVIITNDQWGFFGVFDGHGGDQCSKFIAKRFTEELANGPPENDASIKALALRLDQEFLDSNLPSGSTGTFVIVRPPTTADGKYKLTVGNIGDSRVLLGHADGDIYPGDGTDSGLTTDHKPDHPDERARIERTGGTVQEVMGVPRVNGDLAVSRAFGDAQHKQTGGPSQEDHPVSAVPEIFHLECGPTDFLLLVCDGISEGSFPNADVVRLAAEKLRASPDGNPVDPTRAATAVVHEALGAGSKDNLSCMIVLFGGGEVPGPATELLPGPFEAPDNTGFRKAYTAMAEHAGMSLEQCLETRFSRVQSQLKLVEAAGDSSPKEDASGEPLGSAAALKAELVSYGAGPPEELQEGSPERIAWFAGWLEERHRVEMAGDGEAGDGGTISREQIMEMLDSNPRLIALATQQGLLGSADQERGGRTVRVAPFSELRPAVEAHSALQWDDRLSDVCETLGIVLRDDDSDGTSQVRFPPPLGFKAWLPTSMLHEIASKRQVKIAPVTVLRLAVEHNESLTWTDKLEGFGGKTGEVLEEDEVKALVKVSCDGSEEWLPSSTVTALEKEEECSPK